MIRLTLLFLLGTTALVSCSTRSVVVAPDQVPKLNDSKWTVTSEPAARPR
jgi:hypothetical protein